MAQFDVESFGDYFLDLIQTNLSAKITALNAEKNDGITLETFTNAQYIDDMNGEVVNFASFIFYGFPEVVTNMNQNGDFALDVTMSFEVVFQGTEVGPVVSKKILRYSRALAEIVCENIRKNSQIQSVSVEVLAPVTFIQNANSSRSKIGGIQIKGTIG